MSTSESTNPQQTTEGRQSPSVEKQNDAQIGQPSSGNQQQSQKDAGVTKTKESSEDTKFHGLESNPTGPLTDYANAKTKLS